MLYGKTSLDSPVKVKAEPKTKAFCPHCDQPLIPKCGKIVIWHWAHKRRTDCDSWGESEGEWHLGWKELVNQASCEVTIVKDEIRHRADILIPNGGPVVELQHSPISEDTIAERELFYGNMLWLFDATVFRNTLSISPVYETPADRAANKAESVWEHLSGVTDVAPVKVGNLYRWVWLRPRWTVLSAGKPLLFDLGPTQYVRDKSSRRGKRVDRDPNKRILMATGHVALDSQDNNLVHFRNKGIGTFLDFEQFVGYLNTGITKQVLPRRIRFSILKINDLLTSWKESGARCCTWQEMSP